MTKLNNRNFASAGEIIHDHQFSSFAIFLFKHDNLISCKYFVTFHENSNDLNRVLRVLKFCVKIITSLP